MNIVIEKNVPIPEDNGLIKQLNEMEVNDSFSIPRTERNNVASLISAEFHGKTNKRFFVSVKKQPRGKARVWRVEDAVVPVDQAS